MRSGTGNLLGNDNLRLAMMFVQAHILNKQQIDKVKAFKKFSDDEIQNLVDFSQ
jgi:hypothetical protein